VRMAIQKGNTQSGNTWFIIQDSPISFHITVTDNTAISYDHMERPNSMEHLMEYVENMDKSLYNRDLTNDQKCSIIKVD
jgi:hypothetical protein